jgi:hypothetical protein
MKFKRIQVKEYRQMKLWAFLHTRIKTLAARKGMSANEYLDRLTSEEDEVISPQKQ